MRITYGTGEYREFNDLESGDVFKCDERYCMKVGLIASVDLETGQQVFPDHSQLVLPLDARLVVSDPEKLAERRQHEG